MRTYVKPRVDGARPEITLRDTDGTHESAIGRFERRDRRLVVEREIGPVYEGSDGCFYTAWQVDRRVAEGDWSPCLRDLETGRRLVATADDEPLMLVRVESTTLPEWAELRADGEAVRVVDTRRTSP